MQQCIMALLETFKSLFGRKVIASPQDLQDFLESRSAYYVQKSITEYSQARANLTFSTLLGETGFVAAYEMARWKGFATGLSAVSEVMHGALRDRLALDSAKAAEVLQAAAARLLNAYPVPDFAGADFWPAALEGLSADLARAGLGQPRAAHIIAQSRAQEIFDALPFHAAIRQHDFTMFRNTLSFHLAEIAGELEASRLEAGCIASEASA